MSLGQASGGAVFTKADTELAQRLSAETRRDYLFFLEECARFVRHLGEEQAGEVTVAADID